MYSALVSRVAPIAPPVPLVACAGQVIVDLFVPPLAEMPAAGEVVTTREMLSDVGGCAANTATVLSKLGIPTLLVGKVGFDGQGDWVVNQLRSKGIGVSGLTRSATLPTAQTVILTNVGEDRRYIHAVGANAEFAAADVRAAVGGIPVLAIGGFLTMPGLMGAELAIVLSDIRASGTKVLLDVVIPRGYDSAELALRQVLPHVDCFTPNEDEAGVLTGERDPARQAAALLEWGCRSVVVTRGRFGALYRDSDRVLAVGSLTVDFIDGSGAGDAFAGGLIYGTVQGWPVETRLRFASAVGASVTRGLGTTTTLFTIDEALAAIDDVPLVDSAA